MSASRVRALSEAQLARNEFNNGFRMGFWNESASPPYRVINHHARCRGPTLVIFRGEAPYHPDWAPMPPEWVTRTEGEEGEGVIWMRVGYNTILPVGPSFYKRIAIGSGGGGGGGAGGQ